MLYLGFLLISVAAGMLVYERSRIIRCAALEYKSILALLVFLRGAVMGERKTPAEALLSFSKREEGKSLPWLAELSDEGRVNFFLRERGILSSESLLDGQDKAVLSTLFSSLGRHTAEEESSRIGGAIAVFEKRAFEKGAYAEKNIKGTWIVYLTAVIGAFILLI